MKRKTVFSIGLGLILGLVIIVQGQDPSRVKALEKKITEAAKSGDHKNTSIYYTEIAKLYWNAKNLKKAKEYLTQALNFSKKSGNQNLIFLSYHNLGLICSELKDYDGAVSHYESSYETASKMKSKIKMANSLKDIAIIYTKAGKYKKSIDPLEEALSISVSIKDIPMQRSCNLMLSENYKKLENFKKSGEYLNQYNLLLKSDKSDNLAKKIFRSESERRETEKQLLLQTNRLKMTEDSLRMIEDSLRMVADSLRSTSDSLDKLEKINFEKELQINLLNKDKELADIKIKEQNARLKNEELLRNSIIIGILLAGALVLVLVVDYRKKLKTNKMIRQQNENIKSSINYAKRIQEAMLHRGDQQQLLSDHFILFKPRDVVSGDFYWFAPITLKQKGIEEKACAFAAIDCTGHGVPGAFMSMIGMNSLNGIVSRGITSPNLILDTLHEEIREALRQETTGNNDGMDAALCIYRKEKKTLEFSGAKNGLVYIQNNELHQIKGDIHPIGGSRTKEGIKFKKHEINVSTPTMVYVFSDGYRDQFGGKDHTKFMAKKFHALLLEIHGKPMEQQREILDKKIEEWKGKGQQTDDILVLGVQLGANP